jgi:hypothetical protein
MRVITFTPIRSGLASELSAHPARESASGAALYVDSTAVRGTSCFVVLLAVRQMGLPPLTTVVFTAGWPSDQHDPGVGPADIHSTAQAKRRLMRLSRPKR